MCLPSCGPGFESHAQHPCFFNCNLKCNLRRLKINTKEGIAHVKSGFSTTSYMHSFASSNDLGVNLILEIITKAVIVFDKI